MNDRLVASLAPEKLDCAVRDDLVHLHVSSRSRKFDQSHSPDEFLRKTQTRYGEVLNSPLGLSPIIRRTWDLDLAHRVLVQSIFFNCDHYLDAEESRENWD